jgi:hypothetical protein
MNTATQRWTYHFIGACTGVAGLVLLIATITGAGPLGYSVGAVIGCGFAFGVLACGLKEALARLSLQRFADRRGVRRASDAVPAVAATPLHVEREAARLVTVKRHGVAAVTSLTEVQALRLRAARRRERQRATRTGA